MVPVEFVPFVQRSEAARVVFQLSVAAFAVGEVLQAMRVRRSADLTNLGAEVMLRVVFFGGILFIPLGRVVAPHAVIGGGALDFSLGIVSPDGQMVAVLVRHARTFDVEFDVNTATLAFGGKELFGRGDGSQIRVLGIVNTLGLE